MKRLLTLTFLGIAFSLAQASAKAPLLVKNLALPETLGKIEQRHESPGSSRWIIHIQDVHAHMTAQENISAIVEHVHKLYGVSTVALEGGWGETSFAETRLLKNSRGKQAIARRLLDDSYITGPAYASMFAVAPIRLIGIEDKTLYLKNRTTFLAALKKRSDSDVKLAKLYQTIRKEKLALFDQDLLAFDKALENYRSGDKPQSFIPHILNLAGLHQIDLSAFEQISLFVQLQAAEFKVNKQKLNAEARRLLEKYPGTELSFEELLRSGLVPLKALRYYPATKEYMALMKLKDQLHYQRFFDELEAAIDLLKNVLLKTEAQKKLDLRSERYRLAKKLIHLEAAPKEYGIYLEQTALFKQEMEAAGLGAVLAIARRFYEEVNQRDEIFYRKIKSDYRLGGNLVLVTGGFHTQALSARFEADGISYLTLTPDLGGAAPDAALYHKRLSQTVKHQTRKRQTLSENNNSNFMIDANMGAAIEEYNRSRNIMLALKVAVSFWGTGAAVVPKGVRAAGLPKRPEAEGFVSMEDFLKLPEAEQLAHLYGWITLLKDGKLRIGYAAMQQGGFVRDNPIAADVVEQIKTNRANTLFWGRTSKDPIHDLSIGGRAIIYRFEAPDLIQAITQPNLQRKMRSLKENGRLAAVTLKNQLADSGFVIFPPGDLTLLFVRPVMEGHLGLSGNAAIVEQFYAAIHELLRGYETLAEIMRAA